jgi:hypothetical protein
VARKYEYAEGRVGWAMDAHEERWFIARYLAVAPNIPADQRWRSEFENYFYYQGAGVGDVFLTQINQHCARLNVPSITFRETNVGEYARNPDRAFKAQSRCEWRDEWVNTDSDERRRLMREWEVMMAEAEPAHRTFSEIKADREQEGDYASRQDRQRRELALNAATARAAELAAQKEKEAAVQTERATRLIRQLKMAATLPDGESLLATLLERVEPAKALDLADELDDAVLKTALLKRSMG